MKPGWYILLPDGEREGPYAEEDLMDFLAAGDITAETVCEQPSSGRSGPAGRLFRIVSPVVVAQPAPAPVPWQPAPFPQEAAEKAPAAPPRTRLLYHGHACVACYWRSAVLTAALIAAGVYLKEIVPAAFAVGMLSGAAVLLRAVLQRMSGHFILTTTRVEARRGLFAPRSRELRVSDVRAINIAGSGIPGIGTITFTGPASPADDVTFSNIWRPGRLKVAVRRLQTGPPARS